MQQLDDAMTSVLRNEENIEGEHVGFNHMVDVETIQHFLYRDFPDELWVTMIKILYVPLSRK